MENVINLVLVVIFILLTAFFVGAEFSILKIRTSRLDQLINEGNKKAKIAKKVAEQLDYHLSACQLGITLTALILGALGEPTVERLLHPLFVHFDVPASVATGLSYAIALAVVTFLHVVFGELAPKTIAIQQTEKMVLLLAPPLYWFGKITKPFIAVLNGSSRLILKMFRVKPAGHDDVFSEDELKLIVTQSYESGEINQTELAYLENMFAFDERKLREIMIPKKDMITIDREISLDEMIKIIDHYEYTRYPIRDVTIGPDALIGFINTKEMMTNIAAGRHENLQQLIHKIPRFKELGSIKEAFLKMQQSRTHMALVVNSLGKTVGLVTMEDILSEIVGDIEDDQDSDIL